MKTSEFLDLAELSISLRRKSVRPTHIQWAVGHIRDCFAGYDEVPSGITLKILISRYFQNLKMKDSSKEQLSKFFKIVLEFCDMLTPELKKVMSIKFERPDFSAKVLSDEAILEHYNDMNTYKKWKTHAITSLILLTGLRRSAVAFMPADGVTFLEKEIIIKTYRLKSRDKWTTKMIPNNIILPDGTTFEYTMKRFDKMREPGKYYFFGNQRNPDLGCAALYRAYNFRPHALRHTCASKIAERTGSAILVTAMLDHSSIEMSKRYIKQPSTSDIIRQTWS